MRGLIVFLVVVALAGAAFGAYAVFVQALPETVSSEGISQPYATGQDIENCRAEFEHRLDTRIEELEGIIGQQAKKIAELNNEVAALKNAAPVRLAGDGSGGLAPVEGSDREALKEQLGELMEERRRDERQRQFGRMQEEYENFRTRQLDKTAEEQNWDAQKKQQVTDILTQERTQTQQLWEGARSQEMTQEERRLMGEKMRQIREETQAALKALLSEEEYNNLQRALNPRRGRGGRNERSRPGRGGGGRR